MIDIYKKNVIIFIFKVCSPSTCLIFDYTFIEIWKFFPEKYLKNSFQFLSKRSGTYVMF